MRAMRRTLLPLLASTVLLAACGSDDDGGGSSESAPASNGGAAANQVDMVDLKFEPKTISVAVGDKVTWTNRENVPHNVVNKQDGEQPKSELFNEGGTYSYTPTAAGTIEYVCTIHPGMEGTIEVTGG